MATGCGGAALHYFEVKQLLFALQPTAVTGPGPPDPAAGPGRRPGCRLAQNTYDAIAPEPCCPTYPHVMGEWPESLAWLVAAGVLGIAEVLTLTLVLGLLGGAALLTAGAAALGAPAPLQFVVFGVMSIVLLGGVLPVARRHRYSPGQLVSGAAALVGARGVALERIDADAGTAKISGEVWTARPADPHDVIEPGARVSVVTIQGATAIVFESEV